MAGEQIVGSLGIRIVPDFAGFGEALRAGLGGFSGGAAAAGMGAGAGFGPAGTRSGAAPSVAVSGAGAAATGSAAGMAQAVAAANAASARGDWNAQGMALSALAGGGGPAAAGGSGFGSMTFFGGAQLGRYSSGAGAFQAGGQFGTVRTLGEGLGLSGVASAQVSAFTNREEAARARYIQAIERAAAGWEREANQRDMVSRTAMSNVRRGVMASVGPGGFGGVGGFTGLDPTELIGGAIGRGMDERRQRNIRRAVSITGPPQAFGPDLDLDLLDQLDTRGAGSAAAAENESFAQQQAARRAKRFGGFFNVKAGLRMATFQAIFGGWEVAQAQMAVQQGQLLEQQARTPEQLLSAQIQTLRTAASGPLGSVTHLVGYQFGVGAIAQSERAGEILALSEAQREREVAETTAASAVGIRAAELAGDEIAGGRARIAGTLAVEGEEIRRQIRFQQTRLDEPAKFGLDLGRSLLQMRIVGKQISGLTGDQRVAAQETMRTLQINYDEMLKDAANQERILNRDEARLGRDYRARVESDRLMLQNNPVAARNALNMAAAERLVDSMPQSLQQQFGQQILSAAGEMGRRAERVFRFEQNRDIQDRNRQLSAQAIERNTALTASGFAARGMDFESGMTTAVGQLGGALARQPDASIRETIAQTGANLIAAQVRQRAGYFQALGISDRTQLAQIGFAMARTPELALARGIMGEAQGEIARRLNENAPEEVVQRARDIGVGRLQLARREFFEGFRGQAFDSRMMTISPRDTVDIQKIDKGFQEMILNVQKDDPRKSGDKNEAPSAILSDIKAILGPLAALVEQALQD